MILTIGLSGRGKTMETGEKINGYEVLRGGE